MTHLPGFSFGLSTSCSWLGSCRGWLMICMHKSATTDGKRESQLLATIGSRKSNTHLRGDNGGGGVEVGLAEPDVGQISGNARENGLDLRAAIHKAAVSDCTLDRRRLHAGTHVALLGAAEEGVEVLVLGELRVLLRRHRPQVLQVGLHKQTGGW